MDEKTKITEEIKNLCRKADQNRSIQGMIKDNLVLINKIILLYVTIGSAICAMLIFASIPSTYQVWLGIFEATIFIASIIPGTLNFDLKILERTTAVQAWGEWFRDAKNFINVESLQLDAESLVDKQKGLLDAYKKVMSSTPLIPDNKFNKYKRLHLQKMKISIALDQTPFKTLRQIKKDLSSK